MSGQPPKNTLFKTCLPLIVMVPVLTVLHLAWYKLQYNDALVSAEERETLKAFKFLDKYKFLIGEGDTPIVKKTE